jgi:hypothetical protein
MNLDDAVKNELELWITSTVPKLQKQLEKNNLRDTGELKNSITAQLAYEKGKLSAKVFFEYVAHGQIQDMKSWNFTSLPDVKSLEKWVLNVGISKFSYVPGYQNAKTIPTGTIAANRIAWGIATSWNAQGKIARKKRWRPLKTIYQTLPTIRDMIAQKVIDFGYESIEKALKSLNL